MLDLYSYHGSSILSYLYGGDLMFIYLSMLETDEQKSKFEQFYNKYRKLMFFVANKILKDEYLAEDAVHHTFIKIIENFDKIMEIDCHKTKSYIVIMVRNHSINLYRQHQKHETVPLEEVENYLAEDIAFDVENDDAMTKSIIKLPFIYNEILTLKYVQEYSNSEIAQMLNISEATVRKRLERAKIKVQESIEKEVD